MKKKNCLVLLMLLAFIPLLSVAQSKQPVYFKKLKVDGLDIFYREAGNPSHPTILLLHGFPSSSHMYRDLIDDLSHAYHLIAPDYPGFGESSHPSPSTYQYTFDQLSKTIEHFIDLLQIKKLTLYMQDYGGPVGFRIASRRPELIQALIVQNTNAYREGLGDVHMLFDYMENPNPETEKVARQLLTIEATKWQYMNGAKDTSRTSPDSYNLDQYYLNRPGNDAIQLALFRDYGSNVRLYDSWHVYFRKYQPPTLVIAGKHDKIFIAAGAEAFKKDNPNAQISLLDGGHFVLEEKHQEAAALIHRFLSQHIK